jgi:multidrug resistance efflux pump
MRTRTNIAAAMAAAMAAALCVTMLASCSKQGASAAGANPQAGAQGSGARPAGAAGAQAPGAAGAGGFAGGNGRRVAATAVQAALVSVGQLSADRDTAGVISPVLQSQVAAGASGIVAKVLRQAGDWVASGDTVVQIDDASLKITEANAQASLESAKINLGAVTGSATQSNVKLQLQVDSAQAAYDSAKRFYDAQKALFELGGISASSLDTAKGQLANAQATLEGAKISLDQSEKGIATTASQNVETLRIAVDTATNNLKQARYNLQNAAIKAPFAGQIAAISASPGMYLGQNTAAFTLVSVERQVNFSIAPSDALAVSPGKSLGFELGGKTYAIKVKQAPSLPVNGVVVLTASIEGASALPFGTVGNVSYVVPLARGALVPISALDTLDNRNFAFAIEGGKVTTKNVVVLASSGAVAAVSGLNDGDVVILSPPPGLIDGASVQPTMVAGAVPSGPAPDSSRAKSPNGETRAKSPNAGTGQRPGAAGGSARSGAAQSPAGQPAAKP